MKQERKGKLKGLGKERSPLPLTLATVFSSWESEKSSTTNRIPMKIAYKAISFSVEIFQVRMLK